DARLLEVSSRGAAREDEGRAGAGARDRGAEDAARHEGGGLAGEDLEPSRPDVEALARTGGDLGEALARRLDVEERAVLGLELELDHRARRADVREARPDPASAGVVLRHLQ